MKDLIKEIGNLDDIIDGMLEPIKDYTDTAENIISPIKSMLSIYNLRKKVQLKRFLKGYHKKMELESSDKEVLRNKLSKYLSKRKNVLYLSELIENGFASRSLKCTSILGYIAGKQILNNEEVDNIDEVLIYSLTQINDFDLETIELLKTKESIYKSIGREFENEVEYRIRDILKEIPTINFEHPIPRILSSIEKLKREQILNYGGGGIGSYGNSNGSFIFGEISERLLNYISKI
jgi:hypothetical protein